MENKTISQLTEALTIEDSNVLLMETETETKKITKLNLFKGLSVKNHVHKDYVTKDELESSNNETLKDVSLELNDGILSLKKEDIVISEVDIYPENSAAKEPTKIKELIVDVVCENGLGMAGFVIDISKYKGVSKIKLLAELECSTLEVEDFQLWNCSNSDGITPRTGYFENPKNYPGDVRSYAGVKQYEWVNTVTDFDDRYLCFYLKTFPETEQLKYVLRDIQVEINDEKIDLILNGTCKAISFCGDINTLKVTKEKEYHPTHIQTKWNGKNYIAVGDEYTDPTCNEDLDYPRIVGDILGCDVYNKGRSGMCMSRYCGTSGNLSATKQQYGWDFDVLTVLLGLNDFLMSTPIGTMRKGNFDEYTFYGAYNSFLKYILENNPTGLVILIEPIYRFERDIVPTELNLEKYRECVRILGQQYNLPVCKIDIGINDINRGVMLSLDELELTNVSRIKFGETLSKFISNQV